MNIHHSKSSYRWYPASPEDLETFAKLAAAGAHFEDGDRIVIERGDRFDKIVHDPTPRPYVFRPTPSDLDKFVEMTSAGAPREPGGGGILIQPGSKWEKMLRS